MVWFMLTVPAMVNRRPRTCTWRRAGGQPRDALVVAERDHPERRRAAGDVAGARRTPPCRPGPAWSGSAGRAPSSPGSASPAPRRAAWTGRRSPRPAGPGRSQDSGSVSVAGVLARCRTSGRAPARSASATAARKAASWAGIEGWPGMSAQAKCDQMPGHRTSAARRLGGQRGGDQPRPVGRAWRRSGSCRCRPPGAAARAARPGGPPPRPAPTTAGRARGQVDARRDGASCAGRSGPPSRHSTGTVRPAARSASASAICTTPSQVAPPATAAAGGRAPCRGRSRRT